MEVRAVYENGTISLLKPLLFKRRRVELLVTIPDAEILDAQANKYQKIDVKIQQLENDNKMFQQLWADLDDKYLDGEIRSDSEIFREALEMSERY